MIFYNRNDYYTNDSATPSFFRKFSFKKISKDIVTVPSKVYVNWYRISLSETLHKCASYIYNYEMSLPTCHIFCIC